MGITAPIFTAKGLDVTSGRKVFYYPITSYAAEPVLPIGESVIGKVPIAFGGSSYQEGEIITHGFFFLSFNEWHLIPLTHEKAGDKFNSCVIFLESPIGFRGTNHHLMEDGSEMRVLAEGEVEIGKKGSVGKGKQLALILPINKSLKVSISGKFEGPKTFFYEFDGKNLKAKTWSQKVFDPIKF